MKGTPQVFWFSALSFSTATPVSNYYFSVVDCFCRWRCAIHKYYQEINENKVRLNTLYNEAANIDLEQTAELIHKSAYGQ